MKFGFVTCVKLGLSCMEAIYEAGGRLDLAITLTDDRAAGKSGRVYIDEFCADKGIGLAKIRHINDQEALNAIRSHDIDWLFIIGWSQIAGLELLAALKRGVLGIHPTLLPEGRGRAPIPWAIIKGLKQTGVTLFKLDEGVDTGDIVAQQVIPIAENETATSLYERVTDAHMSLIRSVWPALESDTVRSRKQDESAASIWPGRTPEDGRISPDMTVQGVDRLVRGTTHPYPGAFMDIDGKRYRIWAGHPANGPVEDTKENMIIDLSDGRYLATNVETSRIDT